MALGNVSPVRIHVEDDVRLPRRLSNFLREQIENQSAIVLQGQLSHDEYKEYGGRLQGLKMALDECERITEEITS